MSLPVPKLDNLTFEELVEEARKLIPLYSPEWTDHNLHDPGMTLIDLLAWLVEIQLYRLDYISERHRLKYLKLLGITPLPAIPASVDIQFTTNTPQHVPAKTPLTVTSVSSELVFETDDAVEALPVTVTSLISYAEYQFIDVTPFNNAQKTYFYAFGEHPKRHDALYFGLDLDLSIPLPEKTLKLGIYLFEDDLPPTGEHGEKPTPIYPSSETIWEYWDNTDWQPLNIRMTDETITTISHSGLVQCELPEPIVKQRFPYASEQLKLSDKLFWIRCRIIQAAYEIPPRIHRIIPNIVTVTQGKTLTEHDLGSSSGLPFQEFHIQRAPIVPGSHRVTIHGKEWCVVNDLDASQPDDEHYIIDLATGTIRFGDGLHGAIPPKNVNIHVTYRNGGGTQGNIKAGTINEVVKSQGVEITATNPFPASGGKDAEDIEQAFIRFRKDLMIPYTAVTADDYEEIVKATPGLRVARAKARLSSEHENEVIVVVIPFSFSQKPLPSEGFKRTVCEHLDRHRLITTRLIIRDPDYVRVSVSAEITMMTGYQAEQLKGRIQQELNSFLSPIQRESDDHAWPFGRPVYRSEIYGLLEEVEGVDCVLKLSLHAQEGVFTYSNGNIEIGVLSLVYAGSHTIDIQESQDICKTRGSYE